MKGSPRDEAKERRSQTRKRGDKRLKPNPRRVRERKQERGELAEEKEKGLRLREREGDIVMEVCSGGVQEKKQARERRESSQRRKGGNLRLREREGDSVKDDSSGGVQEKSKRERERERETGGQCER